MNQKLVLCIVLLLASASGGAAPRHSRTGTLAGTVLGPGGRPVAGAEVVIQSADGTNPRATNCNASGRFLFRYLRPGLYLVRSSADGNSSEWLRNVIVRPARQTELTLRLQPSERAAGTLELHGRVKEWSVPVPNALPHDPTVDPRGNIWLTLLRANKLARFKPQTAQWKLYPVPTPHAGPHGLVSDASGNIWFTENSTGKVGRLDARTGKITEYAAPTAKDPHTPIFGPDGMLWFTTQESNLVVRLDPKTGAMREFHVPTPNARPYGIVSARHGEIWFCEFGTDKLGRLDPQTGAIEEFELPLRDARPRRIVVVGEALYFTDFSGGRLGRLDLTHLTFKFWPSPSGANSEPYGLAADTDGNIWYNEFRANQLVEFDPQSEIFTRFTLPSARSEVRNMARDAKGRIWMALSGANKLAVIE